MITWRTQIPLWWMIHLQLSSILLLRTHSEHPTSPQGGILSSTGLVLVVHLLMLGAAQPYMLLLEMGLPFSSIFRVSRNSAFNYRAPVLTRSTGTDIQLFGSAFQASYRVLVDGKLQPASQNSSNYILATVRGLQNTNHTLILRAEIPTSGVNQTQSFVVFDQAIITSPVPAATSNK